jgi:hypothetical protein
LLELRFANILSITASASADNCTFGSFDIIATFLTLGSQFSSP